MGCGEPPDCATCLANRLYMPFNQMPLPWEYTVPPNYTIIWCSICQKNIWLYNGAHHEHCPSCSKLLNSCPTCGKEY